MEVVVKPQNGSQQRSTGRLSPRVSADHTTTRSPAMMYNFSITDIIGHLFNHHEMKGVNIDESLALSDNTNSLESDCAACSEHPNGKCSKHKHLETLRILKDPEKNQSSVSRALNSFPAEVELCTSSVPGRQYGVRALQNIPEGTWIGPYEGKHIRPEDITPEMDTSYMWEIFQDGKLVFYLDASNENQSSWMRYICCARYKDEQNTSVMQYFGNIYYRVFKEIPPGEEILVWYDDSCPHYLGIPLKMQDIGASSASKSRAVVTTSQAVTLPSITQGPITTCNPPTTSTLRIQPKLISPLLPTYRQLEYPYQCPSPAVPRQQVMFSKYVPQPPTNGYDVIIPTKISYNSDHLRNKDDTYPKTSLYGKSVSYSSYKNGSTNTIMTNSITNKPFISHRTKPYSRDLLIDQSKTYSREVVVDQSKKTSNDIKAKTNDLDENGNIKNKLHDKEYYHRQRMIIDSTDRTINKFLSQIEEARNDQKKEKQQQEQKQESNKQVDYDLEEPEISIWKCRQCDKSFAQQQILQLHICSSIPEKPYQCAYCPEAFAQPSELRTHAVIHNGKKPFKCGFCSRLFAGSTTLNNHIRTHTGERPFGCEKCGRAFSQASQLSRHRRTMFECT